MQSVFVEILDSLILLWMAEHSDQWGQGSLRHSHSLSVSLLSSGFIALY